MTVNWLPLFRISLQVPDDGYAYGTKLFPCAGSNCPRTTMAELSEGEKHFIRGGIAQDIRTYGRRRLQFSALAVETGVIPQSSQVSRYDSDSSLRIFKRAVGFVKSWFGFHGVLRGFSMGF
ncbi:hypothetical protein EJB05_24318, partial [Eragrostis curvula]